MPQTVLLHEPLATTVASMKDLEVWGSKLTSPQSLFIQTSFTTISHAHPMRLPRALSVTRLASHFLWGLYKIYMLDYSSCHKMQNLWLWSMSAASMSDIKSISICFHKSYQLTLCNVLDIRIISETSRHIWTCLKVNKKSWSLNPYLHIYTSLIGGQDIQKINDLWKGWP